MLRVLIENWNKELPEEFEHDKTFLIAAVFDSQYAFSHEQGLLLTSISSSNSVVKSFLRHVHTIYIILVRI